MRNDPHEGARPELSTGALPARANPKPGEAWQARLRPRKRELWVIDREDGGQVVAVVLLDVRLDEPDPMAWLRVTNSPLGLLRRLASRIWRNHA